MGIERLEVDGEVFEVACEPGRFLHKYEYTWVAGRHAGDLGFSSLTFGGPLTRKDMQHAIVDFLARVNPDTGYLD
jgi:hypothetical protein